jgi:hypothetical protein
MSYLNDLKQTFSFIISSNVIEGSSIDIAEIIANKGTSTTRKECLDVLNEYGFKSLKSFKENALKLVLIYIKIALKDNLVSDEEINSVRFLKLLLDINEGEFTKDKKLYNEVANIIKIQTELMYIDDDKIDKHESIQRVHLQELFGLNYDEFLLITSDIALDAIERGADWTDLDSYITGEAYSKWYKENKLPDDIKLKKEIEELDREIKNLDEDDNRVRSVTQDVKDKVWNRDGGICVQCGNNENLEFDHIIPFSKGGSNTYRNIQLLCQTCNREKSDNIG